MTTPNVPLRMVFSVEVPGTPEQVWEAIATANGISSWFLHNLRLYLARFPGQRVTSMEVAADVKGHADTVWSAIRQALGAGAVGQLVDARGLTGKVERIGASPGLNELLLSLTDPVAGFLGFFAHDKGDGSTMASIQGWLFSDGARGYIEREQPAWQAWLENLETATAHA